MEKLVIVYKISYYLLISTKHKVITGFFEGQKINCFYKKAGALDNIPWNKYKTQKELQKITPYMGQVI